MPGAFLCLAVVGVELVALWVHFDSCGSLRAPVPVQPVSLVVDVELVQKGLNIALVLSVQEASLEFLSEDCLI